MSNFKSGSGNLDFGGDDADTDDENDESPGEASLTPEEDPIEAESSASGQSFSASVTETQSETATTSDQSPSNGKSTDGTADSNTPGEQYPYFVRRSNVGDERDTRLEIHVRDKVANHEAEFRNNLADSLGTNEVSKTDAREFALLAAFQHPEQVANLMREEGFGTFG